jgi:hypothetical protein
VHGDRRDVHDRPSPGGDHPAGRGLRRDPVGALVHRDHLVVLLEGHIEERSARVDRGVVDERSQRAELGGRAVDRVLDRLRVTQVDRQRQRAPAGFDDVLGRRVQPRLIDVEQGDVEAVGREAGRGGPAERAGGPGDERGRHERPPWERLIDEPSSLTDRAAPFDTPTGRCLA